MNCVVYNPYKTIMTYKVFCGKLILPVDNVHGFKDIVKFSKFMTVIFLISQTMLIYLF